MSDRMYELIYAREWKKCAPDWETSTTQEKVEAFTYFAEKYAKIRHPMQGRIPFVLREAQVATVEDWLENRYSIALKARQIGFSTLVSNFCFWLTFFYPDRHVIMLSRTEREAAKLLNHARYTFSALPEWLRLLGPVTNKSWTQKGCVMVNNSNLESMPSANNPARGSTAFLIVCDEFAFIPNSDEAWADIEPVADVGGRVILLSTANGEGNLFHTMWVGSQTKTGTGRQFHGLFHPWWASDRDDDWYETKKAELPEWQLAQEYPSNPEEAFLKSGRPVFDLEVLRGLELEEPLVGRLYEGEWIEEGKGPLKIWEFPDPDAVYAIGADVALGLEHGDYSSAHVVNARTGKIAAAWHGHIEPDEFGEVVLNELGRYYNNALMAPENNNHGHTVVRALVRVNYPNMYFERSLKGKKAKKSETLGWSTNVKSKYRSIDNLGMRLRKGEIELLDEETVAELRTYVREGDGKMHGSPHDDRVMSLAITCAMLDYVWLPEYRPRKAKPPSGTWGHLFNRVYKTEKPKEPLIGANSVRNR